MRRREPPASALNCRPWCRNAAFIISKHPSFASPAGTRLTLTPSSGIPSRGRTGSPTPSGKRWRVEAMANYVFKLPDVGEGIAEAEIVAWHVKVGDAIKEDQPLVDVMTDKATVEIGSPVTGRVFSRKGETGDKAAVGDELVVI